MWFFGSLNSNLNNKSKVDYIDVTITNDNGVSVSSATGYVVSFEKFISAYVIGSNNIAVIPYTYSNLMYCRLKNMDDMTNATNGNYTVRVWYRV